MQQEIKSNRSANFELLRVIAISMILILHFFVHGGIMELYPYTKTLLPLMILGVPLFILLSGYFRIKLQWKSFIRLSVTLMVFNIVNIAASHFIIGVNVKTMSALSGIISPLTHSPYWFITTYCGLFIISPIINKGIESMTIYELRKTVVILSTVIFVFCWALGSRLENNGFGIFNFIYLYILGAYISREERIKQISNRTFIIIAILAISLNLILNFVDLQRLGYFMSDTTYSEDFAFRLGGRYTNPLSIILSCIILILMGRSKINNRFILYLGSASLGCYLLQEGYFGQEIYPITSLQINDYTLGQTFMLYALEFVLIWAISLLVTQILVKPLTQYLMYLPKRFGAYGGSLK